MHGSIQPHPNFMQLEWHCMAALPVPASIYNTQPTLKQQVELANRLVTDSTDCKKNKIHCIWDPASEISMAKW